MDGKALYEYARTNTPLPRPIEARKVTVHELELVNFIPATEHAYEPPKEAMDWKYVQKLERLVEESTGEQVPDERPEPVEDVPAAAFEIKMKVSGGTYVRTSEPCFFVGHTRTHLFRQQSYTISHKHWGQQRTWSSCNVPDKAISF